jgi:tetratricopeptide (TPR) repeat protein
MNVQQVAIGWLFGVVAALAVPAYAVPGFIRDVVVPDELPPTKDDWIAEPDRAATLYEEARQALTADRTAAALRLVTRAIAADHETNPAERGYFSFRANCMAEQGDLRGNEAVTLYNAAHDASERGEFAVARRLYECALVEDPLLLWAANNRAWLAATHPDPEARKDPDAVALALYACVKSEWHNWSFVDTLGAAYAESGDFPSAERCAERALALAPPENRPEVRDSLAAYRKRQPRRDPVAVALMGDDDDTVIAAAEDPFADAANLDTQPVVLERITLPDLTRAMDRAGYKVAVQDDRFVAWMIEGVRAQIFVTNEGRSIQFHAAFDDDTSTLARVNEWNRSKCYSRSYLDDDGDPHLELDLEFSGGICAQRVLDFLQTCRLSLAVWVKEVIR